jgi:hypothetical protein
MSPFLFINTDMKSFKRYTTENTVSYGKLQPHDEMKIRNDDRIISHFRNSGVLSTYENRKYPNNQETMHELLYLKNRMENVSDDDLLFANHAETDEQEMYRKFADSLGIKLPEDFVSNIMKQVEPILFHLKKHHDRARPEQFAAAHNIPFQTSITHTALHPAYPSGHAFDSHIMEHYLKMLSPEHSSEVEEFCRKMRESRLDAGLHYPSDNVISKDLAHDVIKHKLIQIPGV